MLRVGDKLRSYQVLAQLRSGGMGTLYLAAREGAAGFRQYVAIKLIDPQLSLDPRFVTSFVNEALLGARISHPNVVRVEELGEEKGSYFLVMEYVHGCSAAELLQKLRSIGRILLPEVAVSIVAQVADGLHAAHEATDETGAPLGLVHRDISPHNVILGVSGAVKLIDFGIAKAMRRAGSTATGRVKGKIRYMSPEQAWGRAVDRKSDVYSLAIVLWEMLAGRRLFPDGDDLAALDQVRSPAIEPPSRWNGRVPKALDAAVMEALRVDPLERTPTARDLRTKISRAVPPANTIDGSHLAQLIAEVMYAELAGDEHLPPEVRASGGAHRFGATLPTMTVEAGCARPKQPSLAARIAPRFAVALLGLGAGWTAMERIEAHAAPPMIRAEPVPLRSHPAPAPVVVEVVPEPPAPKPAKLRTVDGVPLFEEPDF